MKKNIAYVIGLILMFSSAGAYLNAQEMGDEDIGIEQEEIAGDFDGGPGMRGGMEMRKAKGPGDREMRRGDKKMFPRENMDDRGDNNQNVQKKVIETIKKHEPEFAKKLEELKKTAGRKYQFVLRNASRPLMMALRRRSDASMEKDIVEGIKLEYETRELSFKYKEASSGEKEAIEKSLTTKVSRLFDLRAKGQEARIKEMDKEIKKLRAKLEDRKAHKSKIVKSRIDKLIGISEEYDW
ncbi:MAG: hypothetical protein L6420_10995 [Elusimicrobia bacterium]|nr:hypothetical protein [Elusimicrobiota bacterium]